MQFVLSNPNTLIIKRMFDPHLKDFDGNTSLHNACKNNLYSIVSTLLDNGAKINIKNKNGYSPLHLATFERNYLIVELLIEHEADINIVDNDNETPLHIAVLYGYIEIVKLLIANGANVNMKSNTGYVIHYALYSSRNFSINSQQRYQQFQIISILLQNGASTFFSSYDNENILNYAIYHGLPENIITFLKVLKSLKNKSKNYKLNFLNS